MSSLRRRVPPDLTLERWLLDELSREEQRALDAEFEPHQLREHQLRLQRENLELEPVLAANWRTLERKLAAISGSVPTRRAQSRAWSALALCVAASALLTVMVGGASKQGYAASDGADMRPEHEVVRFKGRAVTLLAFRKRGAALDVISDGDSASAGDIVQLGYTALEPRHAVLVSLDGRGVATLHFPAEPSDSTLLPLGNGVLLPNAYVLDDAPLFERFVLVMSRSAFDPRLVLDRIARGKVGAVAPVALQLAPLFDQQALTLQKRAP